MPQWVTRTVLSGSSVDQNGTNSHTCTFTAATSGNLLVAVVTGAVTFTTPTGWTLAVSTVGDTGLYVFTKTANASESSLSTTHNASNYPILGVVYEYYAGTTTVGTTGAIPNQPATYSGPACTSLTGTYTRFAARSWNLTTNGSASGSCAWTLPTVEDYDAYITGGAGGDGDLLSIAYDDASTGSSFTPSATLTATFGNRGEIVSFALSVTTAPTTIPLQWVQGVNSP